MATLSATLVRTPWTSTSNHFETARVEMPIASEVDAVLREGRSAEEAFRGLGRIAPTSEIDGVA